MLRIVNFKINDRKSTLTLQPCFEINKNIYSYIFLRVFYNAIPKQYYFTTLIALLVFS